MKFQTGHTEQYIREHFVGTRVDDQGIVRWLVNDQIPFDEMLADFRTLGLIDADAESRSNDLREQETEQFWEEFFKTHKKENTYE